MKAELVPFYQIAAVPPASREIRLLVNELRVLLEKARVANGSDLESDNSDQETVEPSHDGGRHESVISSLKSVYHVPYGPSSIDGACRELCRSRGPR